MAQNLTINGVTYSSVSSLSIPKSGGGNAVFPDTSDANATESDIALNKTAYVNGSKITGTATGGGGGVETCTLTIRVDKEPGGDNAACVYATAPDGAQSYNAAGTYTILKNSVLGIYSLSSISGSYQNLSPVTGLNALYKATGNLTIWLSKGF